MTIIKSPIVCNIRPHFNFPRLDPISISGVHFVLHEQEYLFNLSVLR